MSSAAEESRLGALDRVLDEQQPVSTLAGELFAVVDAIEGQPALRRSLTDPGMPEDQRKALVRQLLKDRISSAAVWVVEQAVGMRWSGGRSLIAALERQGVRAELRAAQQNGQLDNVEDELFRFGRTVAGERGLGEALRDRRSDVSARRDLVTRLLDGKAHEATVVLARRAVAGRSGSYDDTVDSYLALAADLRRRGLATVRVARPLTPEQHERLRAALSRQVGREVAMHVVVDPEVLGGVRVELGDEVIEGTVSGRLDDARRQIH
ncbi:MAG TPA: F0F1 ATP synthase subunit delta [Propionibacterium sp.]|jgi:F-type H+-transporting ATPase subunit delta|nr:F0F1 ATP synthase subunit delta [Propionibacterium sp.]